MPLHGSPRLAGCWEVGKKRHNQAVRFVIMKGSFNSTPVCCAGVRGITIETTRAVRIVTGTNPITSTTTSVSVWFAPHRYELFAGNAARPKRHRRMFRRGFE